MEFNINEIVGKDCIQNFKHLDRRQENDPTYQGYFALDGFDQRQFRGSQPGMKREKWHQISMKEFFVTF